MEPIFYIIYTFLIITISISVCIWSYLFLYFIIYVRKSPSIEKIERQNIRNCPSVSIIIPALNEEEHISTCLESLLNQDYPNLEIIVVNDSSIDNTESIVNKYKKKYPEKIVFVISKLKPENWIGKNWACYLGYSKSTGQILIFIDADTILTDTSTISVTVTHLIEKNLESLTIRPFILLDGIWANIIFPLLWIFSQIKYSCRRMNDPSKSGYLFGCFYLITRNAYEVIGTHKAVKNHLIEDLALGEKIKQKKIKFSMLLGEQYVKTKMTGNFMETWQGLKRSINLFPFYDGEVITCFLIFLLLLEPVISLFLIACTAFVKANSYDLIFIQIFSILSIVDMVLIYLINVLQSSQCKYKKSIYTLTFPISCIIVSISLIFFIVKSKRNLIISWRGRSYIVTKPQIKSR